jgi:4-amino-4-deoxy-L-arabinose transferase-like glycosyltransferase
VRMPAPDRLPARLRVLLGTMVLVSAAVRLHNVIVFPGLRAPDGFGHFTYIWHLAATGNVPLATAGWSFFHPPLYYAWMAGVWNAASALPGETRLAIGTGVIALLALVHAGVALRLLGRRLPHSPVARVAAAAMLLFLPVQLYSAGYVGNEALGAVLCSLSLLATLAVLDRPTNTRAALLGLVLGAAMMTKFTALAFVAGAFTTILLRAIVRRRLAEGARVAAVAATVLLALCAPFYARNLAVYGNPFQMSRDTLAVRRVENIQSQGQRTLAEYLLSDPMVFVRPQWPAGIPLTGDIPPTVVRSALRESVWTGAFANTFFDAVGGQVLPLVTHDNSTRRAGQVLLTLAALPTLIMLAGILVTLRGLWREGWRDEDVLLLVFFAFQIGLFVLGTLSVPMHAAVKATYLAPGWAMFGYWFGRGLDELLQRRPRLGAVVLADVAALAVASTVVFTLGVVVGRGYLDETAESPTWQNVCGVVALAGGDRDTARAWFEKAVTKDWHLGFENLAALAFDEGRPLEATYQLRLAAKLQGAQSFGTPEDQAAFDRLSQAEYANSAAVFYHRLGWMDAATASVRRSLELASDIPEAFYDDGVLALERARSSRGAAERAVALRHADASFARALALDGAFHDAAGMRAVVAAWEGRCDDTRALGEQVRSAAAAGEPRLYPVETNTGDLHTSAIERRRFIRHLPPPLTLEGALDTCRPPRDEATRS